MHAYALSPAAREQALRVRGQLRSSEPVHAARTALVVIDMQNFFLAPGAACEIAPARAILPKINALAARLRERGVLVVWVQTDASLALQRWARHHRSVLAPQHARRRMAGLDPAGEGFALYPAMQPHCDDWRATKTHYSAFIAGSSDLDARLRARGIDTLLIAGTATNVCCESSARDASMLNYRVIMVADANASWTDAAHAATLDLFAGFFGDVMSADEAARAFA